MSKWKYLGNNLLISTRTIFRGKMIIFSPIISYKRRQAAFTNVNSETVFIFARDVDEKSIEMKMCL
jgi:hypothetical protein